MYYLKHEHECFIRYKTRGAALIIFHYILISHYITNILIKIYYIKIVYDAVIKIKKN